MARLRHTRVSVLLLVASVVLTGCGTTVRDTGTGPAPADGPLAVVPSALPGGPDDVPPIVPGKATESVPGQQGSAPFAPGTPGEFVETPAARGGTSSTRPPVFGRGVTAREILVGLFSYDNSAALAPLGPAAASVYAGDPRKQAEALVAHMNKNGGIAGRAIKLVVYEVQDSDYGPVAEQAACSMFTQDHKVFAVLATTETTAAVLPACLHKVGVPLINTFSGIGDAVTYAAFPNMYDTAALMLDEAGRLLVEGVAAQHYFKDGPTSKYGFIGLDNMPTRRVLQRVIEPTLKARGVVLDEVFLFCCDNEDVADISGAVLKFKNENIDHVFMFGTEGGGLELLWMQSAEAQAYRPRYGMTSQTCPGCQVMLAPDAQLERSLLVGWAPLSDLGTAAPGVQLPPAFAECIATMREQGVDVSGEGAQSGSANTCDRLYFFRAGVQAGLPDITSQSFARGAAALGTSFRSSVVYAARWAVGRHYGVAAWRPATYDRGTDRFRYTGPLQPA